MMRITATLERTFTTVLFTAVMACNNRSAEGNRREVDSLFHLDSVREQIKGKNVDLLIAPGTAIGKAKIGMNTEALIKAIGEPDLSDAAMGKAWLTWYNNRNASSELDVYTAYKDSNMTERTVQLIRASSQNVSTKDSIGVGTFFGEIGKKFPGMRYVSHYRKDSTGEIVSLYADQNKGIAFEFSAVEHDKKCSSVIVFDTSRPLLSIYESFLNIHRWKKYSTAP
jgi:hypothetical protein